MRRQGEERGDPDCGVEQTRGRQIFFPPPPPPPPQSVPPFPHPGNRKNAGRIQTSRSPLPRLNKRREPKKGPDQTHVEEDIGGWEGERERERRIPLTCNVCRIRLVVLLAFFFFFFLQTSSIFLFLLARFFFLRRCRRRRRSRRRRLLFFTSFRRCCCSSTDQVRQPTERRGY